MKLKGHIFKKRNKIGLSAYSEQERLEMFKEVAEFILKDTRYSNTKPKELLFNENEEINVDLWPSNKWTQEELESFKNVFKEFGNASGQISNEPRGLTIETAIYFISAAVAAGFFGKFGSDTYDLFKEKIKNLLLKQDSNSKLLDTEIDGYLNLKYDDSDTNTKFYYACFYSSEEGLSFFLSNINKIDSLIHNAQKLNLFPFNKGNDFNIHVEFGQKTNYKWDILITRFIRKGGLIVFNEAQHGIFKSEKLDELQWKNIKWEQSEGKTDLESMDEYTIKKMKEMKKKKIRVTNK